jgi:hypothetical protein
MLFEQLFRKHRFALFVLWIALITFGCVLDTFGQEPPGSSLPDMSDFFDSELEPIPDDERPVDPKLVLPNSLAEVPLPISADERQELSTWVRWLVLRNLPPSFEDNRKWGREKEVVSGIHFRREGWKIETKRKRKTVKHGTWSRYYIEFVDPAANLQVNIQKMEFPKTGPIRIATQVIAPLKLFGRVSEWRRDVQWISLSTNAEATIELNVACDIHVIVNPLKIPPDVEFRPVVTDATVALQDFEVHNISQLHGPLAELLGKGIREVLDNRLEDYREKLVVKMNSEITKQKGKLKLSLQDWMQTSVRKKAE